MKKKITVIVVILLAISLLDSLYLRLTTPKQKKYSCYIADMKLVDNETGEPLNPIIGFSSSITASNGGSRITKTSGSVAYRSEMDNKTGHVRIIWMAEDSIPCRFTVGSSGYEIIPIPKKAIDKIDSCKSIGGMSGPLTIKLKKE